MTMQYIGARYVPLFFNNPDGTNEWVQGISYEPLTIVTYLGSSFTSRKQVPSGVGSPNLNAEYWAETGNYNAQVEEYRKEVTELSNKTYNLTNKNIIVVSDSYGTGGTQSGTTYKTFIEYAKDFTGLNIYNLSESGAGFANTGDSGHNFKSLLLTLDDDVDKNTITDIYVLGGYNDRTYLGPAILQGIKEFKLQANNLYPNARVFCGFIAWSRIYTDYDSLFKTKIAYETCTSLGVPYLINIETTMHDLSRFDSDNIHPNEYGNQGLAEQLVNAIYTNNCIEADYTNIDLTITPYLDIVYNHGFTERLKGNNIFFGSTTRLNVTNMIGANTITCDGNNPIKIGALPKTSGYFIGNKTCVTSVPGVIILENSDTVPAVFDINITNSEISLNIIAYENHAPITSKLQYAVIEPFMVTFDSSNN